MKLALFIVAPLLIAADPALAADVVTSEEEANLFAGSIFQSIAAILAFLILLAVLSKYAWAPIITSLQDRENRIREDLRSAERASREAQSTLTEYQKQLADARQESQRIVAEARAVAQQAANADKARIEAEITSMKASAKADIAAAKEAALADIYAQSASLSTAIAGKILQRELNPADQQTLVNQSLDQLRSSAASN